MLFVRKLLIDAEVKKITDALESNESVLKRAWDVSWNLRIGIFENFKYTIAEFIKVHDILR